MAMDTTQLGRHFSGVPSRPASCGFGLDLLVTHNGEQRLKPAAQSQLCSPNPEQHRVGENRSWLGRERHKRWWGRGTEEGLERDRPTSGCKPWGYSRSAGWAKSKQRKLRHPHTHPHPLNPKQTHPGHSRAGGHKELKELSPSLQFV